MLDDGADHWHVEPLLAHLADDPWLAMTLDLPVSLHINPTGTAVLAIEGGMAMAVNLPELST